MDAGNRHCPFKTPSVRGTRNARALALRRFPSAKDEAILCSKTFSFALGESSLHHHGL